MSKAENQVDAFLSSTVELKRPHSSAKARAAQAVMDDMPILFGKYSLTKRLGQGGMAEAFLAETEGPSGFHKTLVVKRMLGHLVEDESFVRMFQREARLAALLTHTNVVQIYELGAIDGVQFISMEYVDGAPLHRLTRQAWRNGSSVPLELVCCAIADAALGLAAAHDLCDDRGKALGIVHRDISPDNLMMNREGVTKILDFGVAKAADGERTATGLVKGKVAYFAPEQVLGHVVDKRTDLYALGVTFYGLVTGKRPFRGHNDVDTMARIIKDEPRPPWELNAAVPRRVNDLILRLMAKDPDQRPQDGTMVHDELVEALSARRTVAVPFVRDFLATKVVPARLPPGPHFRPTVAVTAPLLAWPLCEGAREIVEDAHPTSSILRGDLISSGDSEPPVETSAGDPRASRGPLSIDSCEVEELADADAAGKMALAESRTLSVLPIVLPSTDGEGWVGDKTMASLEPPVRPRRPVAAIGAAVAILLLIVLTLAVLRYQGPADLVLEDAPAAAPVIPSPEVAAPVDVAPVDVAPVDVAPVDVAPVDVAPVDVAPVDAAPEPIVASGRRTVIEAARKPARETKPDAKGAELQTRAPSQIQWQLEGKVVGAGSAAIKVPLGTTTLTAVDRARGGRSSVPVVEGVADYGALPRGKLHPRANPYAEVYLGSQLLGTTPFAPIEAVVGTYTLRFVHAGKQEQRTVDVTSGAVARVSVNFE